MTQRCVVLLHCCWIMDRQEQHRCFSHAEFITVLKFYFVVWRTLPESVMMFLNKGLSTYDPSHEAIPWWLNVIRDGREEVRKLLQWRANNRNRWHVERVHAVIEDNRTAMYTVTATQAGIFAANRTKSYWNGFQASQMRSVDTAGRWTLSVMVQEGSSSPFSLFESVWVVDALIWPKIETWICRKYAPTSSRKEYAKKRYGALKEMHVVFFLPWRNVLNHTAPPRSSGIGKYEYAKLLRKEMFINLELSWLEDWQIDQILTTRSIRDVRSLLKVGTHL
jgi:hypothetical protein